MAASVKEGNTDKSQYSPPMVISPWTSAYMIWGWLSGRVIITPFVGEPPKQRNAHETDFGIFAVHRPLSGSGHEV